VHDLAHETFPLLFKNDPIIKFKKKIIYKADHIIAISEFTKNELLKFYKNLNPYKISVIYHGCSLPEYIKSFKDDINCFDYFLYTGNRGGYKNFIPLIKSISHLLIKYNIKLICTGLKFTKNELLLFNEYNISDLLIHKFANDIELSNLYSNAIAFIFPSYYEGFGLPILECFNYGCPLLISNTSCFPEIANDAALYFDPYNAEDIYKKVESIILDFSLRNSLIINGKKRLKLFDWSKTSLLTSNIYESLL
jgi:glycosyltransferase involved in cell wall biosynthesis